MITYDCLQLFIIAYDFGYDVVDEDDLMIVYNYLRLLMTLLMIAYDCLRLLTIAYDCLRLLTIAYDCL
ncbi:unnamed protein product [Wuchereria bancrofti]|uniref:Uncharacterized protein n=1 Tax=Wuchereria bancrofti TaxID=6293 RepID=A0A3P7E3A0_WUCBA|nr:unnamed protein product [Wuchereria bancrofti]